MAATPCPSVSNNDDDLIDIYPNDKNLHKVSFDMDRKKSISLLHLFNQDENYFSIPEVISETTATETSSLISTSVEATFELRQMHSMETFLRKSYESIQKIASKTSLTVPDNFSFASLEIKTYNIRWVLLGLCIMTITISYIHWIQYSIVSNIVVKYYQIPSIMVDWTSIIFMVAYIVLVFPISFFMDIRGLRQTVLFGAVGTAVGAWIKVFSLKRNYFIVSFMGQAIVAISQVFLLSVPSRLATTWFEPKEAALVCGLGVFGGQLGTALGSFFTPWIVQNHDKMEIIEKNLGFMYIGCAGFSTICAIIIAATFKSEPKNPPSHIQAIQRSVRATNKGYWRSCYRLLTNKNFILLVLAYGINVGVYTALFTLLNQIVLKYYPNSEQDAGNIGLTIILTGLFGSLVFSFIMDTTHKYKEMAVWVYGLTALGVLLFCLALKSDSKMLLYISSVLMGLFMTGMLPIASEFAAEITFPEPDGPVAGILNISTHIFGIVITLAIKNLQIVYGDMAGNMGFIALLIMGTILMCYIKNELRRNVAHREVSTAAEELARLEFEIQDDHEIDKKTPCLTVKIDQNL